MEALGIMGFVLLAFILFVIFFIFKILQFVIQAINLYKKILNRQDAILKILLDIRDNTKKFENICMSSEVMEDISSDANDDGSICEECKTVVPADAKSCPKCGAEFE